MQSIVLEKQKLTTQKRPIITFLGSRQAFYTTKTVTEGFGARYLDPKTSRWISADPALGEYVPVAPINDDAKKQNGNLPGIGGVFNYVNMHVYHYAGNNPVKYVDPDGESATAAGAIFGAIGGAIKGVSKSLESGQGINASYVVGHALIGAAKGAAVGLVIDATVVAMAGTIASGGIAAVGGVALVAAAAGATGAIVGAVGNIVEQKFLDNQQVNWGDVSRAALVEGAFATVGGAVGAIGKGAEVASSASESRKLLVPTTQRTRHAYNATKSSNQAGVALGVGYSIDVAQIAPDAYKTVNSLINE